MVVTCGRQFVGDEVAGSLAKGKIYLQKPTQHEVIVVACELSLCVFYGKDNKTS